MIRVDFSGLDYDTDLDGRREILPPGRYTFEITRMATPEKGNGVEVHCVVVGPHRVGAKFVETFHLTDKIETYKRFGAFLKRMGVLKKEDCRGNFSFDPTALNGELVVADVAHRKFTNDKGTEMTFDQWGMYSFWRAGDEPGTPGRAENGRRREVPTAAPQTRSPLASSVPFDAAHAALGTGDIGDADESIPF